jgi:hypothetical protein
MTDHLVVQIVLHWGLGLLLAIGGLCWVLLVAFAGAMADGDPNPGATNRAALIGAIVAVVGVLILIFL